MDIPHATAAAVAATVKHLLAAAEISEAAASRKTGIPLTTLNRRLTGFPPGFTITELVALASLLETDVSSIIRQSEPQIAAGPQDAA